MAVVAKFKKMTSKAGLYTELERFAATVNFDSIAASRRSVLRPLIDFIRQKASTDDQIRLNMICTHNSRRSHLAQVWAQVAAAHYDIANVFCYSGGTQETEMFPMVIETLKASGFRIQALANSDNFDNPVYAVKFAPNTHAIICFSKTHDHEFNPKTEFAAVMTCWQADADCPVIVGAEKRIAIPYEDPKIFDTTPHQAEKYRERNLQIATEMFYVFSQIN